MISARHFHVRRFNHGGNPDPPAAPDESNTPPSLTGA